MKTKFPESMRDLKLEPVEVPRFPEELFLYVYQQNSRMPKRLYKIDEHGNLYWGTENGTFDNDHPIFIAPQLSLFDLDIRAYHNTSLDFVNHLQANLPLFKDDLYVAYYKPVKPDLNYLLINSPRREDQDEAWGRYDKALEKYYATSEAAVFYPQIEAAEAKRVTLKMESVEFYAKLNSKMALDNDPNFIEAIWKAIEEGSLIKDVSNFY